MTAGSPSFARILEVLAKHATAAAAELRAGELHVRVYGTPQPDPVAAREFLDGIGPVEPVEARFTVATDGETTDCCSEAHYSPPTYDFNISVINPAPERASDSVNRRIGWINP